MWSTYKVLGPPQDMDTPGTTGGIPLLQGQSRGASTPDVSAHGQHPANRTMLKYDHHGADGIEVVQAQPGLELSPSEGRGYSAPPGYSGGSYFQPDHRKPINTQYSHTPVLTPRERKIAGLRPRTFWALVIILVLILALGVGAGVGAGLALQKSNKSPAKSSPTPSSTPSPTGGTSSPLTPTDGCPGANGTIVWPIDNKTGDNVTDHGDAPQPFITLCNTSYPVESNQFTVSNLFHVYEPTLYDCIQACALFNNVQSNVKCAGVGFERLKGGYCYLKNTTLPDIRQALNFTDNLTIDSAVIIPLASV